MTSRVWTDVMETRLCAMLAVGKGGTEIGKALGCSRHTALAKARRLELAGDPRMPAERRRAAPPRAVPLDQRTCVDCGGRISKSAKERCSTCSIARINTDPTIAARRRARVAEECAKPEVKARQRASMARYIANMPDADREKRREHGRRVHRTVLSRPDIKARANSPEVKARAGRSRTNTVLAWCPPEFRERYRFLKNTKLLPAAQARAVIEDEIATAARRAEAALSPFERQMARLAAGATIVTKFEPRRADHDFTLGGVATGML